MSFIKELRTYFFRANAPINPNVAGDKRDNMSTEGVPSQDTMERFTASHLNFRERGDRAKQAGKDYNGNTYATPAEDFELVGHVQIATDDQVLAYEDGMNDTPGEESTKVVHPQQLTEDASNPETLVLDGVTNSSSAPSANTETIEVIKDIAETRRNRYLYRISETFRTWINGVVTNLTNINTYTYGTGGEDSPAENGTGLGGAIFGPGGTQAIPTQPGLLTTIYGPSGDPNSPNGPSVLETLYGPGGTPSNPAPGGSTLLPIGTVLTWVAALAPSSEWLVCDGSAVSRSTYSGLFAVMGTSFGIGDGATTFNLPDLRGNFIAGYGGAGDYATLGNTGGADSVALTPAETAVKGHTHGQSLGISIASSGAHQHVIAFPTGPSAGGGDAWDLEPSFERATRKGWDGLAYAYTGTKNATSGGISPGGGDPLAFPLDQSHWDADGNHTHTGTVTGSIDALADGANGAAHENRPPFLVMNHIIKAL
jgi:microcystin-dependent protein